MRRREFITLVGCGAVTWPLAARAQQPDRVRRIAVLMNNAEHDPEGQTRASAFRQGLQALGWTEGKSLRIDWYWTAGDIGRIRGDVTGIAGDPPDIGRRSAPSPNLRSISRPRRRWASRCRRG
jgi:putative tryptophan/tyrosine transport system substrate-binding protein